VDDEGIASFFNDLETLKDVGNAQKLGLIFRNRTGKWAEFLNGCLR